jgi:iron complex transport system substrate-binding protein
MKIVGVLLILLAARASAAREIVDMRGRHVQIPDRIDKVFATSPPGTYLIYAIDPTLMVGLNFPLWNDEKKYTAKHLQSLPVIGGMVGTGRTINQEVLLRVHPDVIVIWDFGDTAVDTEYEDMFRRMDIPFVYVRSDKVSDYPTALRFMGKLLGREARGQELEAEAHALLGQVEAALANVRDRPRVYYAEGVDGLATDGDGSMHAELIEVAGARNVHKGGTGGHYGMERISLEQVMAYDPDIILVKERAFYQSVFNDPRWKALRAVAHRRVFMIPCVPFNWFDRPPSFMRLLGAQWLVSVLHPGRLSVDLSRQTRAFYRKFLGVELSEQAAKEVLEQ